MHLPQVDILRLQAAQRALQVTPCSLRVGCRRFCHQEYVIAIAGREECAITGLTLTLLITLGGVEEPYPALDSSLDDGLRLHTVHAAHVPTPESEHRHRQAGAPESAPGKQGSQCVLAGLSSGAGTREQQARRDASKCSEDIAAIDSCFPRHTWENRDKRHFAARIARGAPFRTFVTRRHPHRPMTMDCR